MTLIDVHTLFSTDEKCRELLKRLRWSGNPECPRCSTEAVMLETEKELFYCKDCDYQFSTTSNTIFHDTHLPLLKWFVAVYLLCESRKGMSANQIKRVLGVSYKTAWFLCHRIRFAMKEINREKLSGTVEMDETFVGGKRRQIAGVSNRADKAIVVGIRERGGRLRFFHSKDIKSGTLAKYIRENVDHKLDAFMTDDFNAYKAAVRVSMPVTKHKIINHSKKVYVNGDIHTNTIESAFSLLKRGIMGTWHTISAKHLQAYLDEMTFRFDRRNESDLFIDTLHHMITADPLTFQKLTA